MPEPLAYLNGTFLPFSQVTLPITDAGFVQGVTVAEQLRTFGGKLFRLERHLARLQRSLEIIGVSPEIALEELGEIAGELVVRNQGLLAADDDLGLTMFVTPGPYSTYTSVAARPGPTVCIHTQPLPFHLWCEKYERGESLVVTPVRQVPENCWPTELKCRSRMHYFLADREAGRRQAGARALLLDQEGWVTESSTANVVAYFADEGLVSPPQEKILPGVSVAVVRELAAGLNIPFVHRPIRPEELSKADEILLCSTSPCVWSVTRFDGRPVSGGKRGETAARLLSAWSSLVGIDIEAQARRFSQRSARGN